MPSDQTVSSSDAGFAQKGGVNGHFKPPPHSAGNAADPKCGMNAEPQIRGNADFSERRYLAGMERLIGAVQELSLARDLATIQRIVRTTARELTGADGATFVLRDNGYCYYADEDAISPLWKSRRFPIQTCISGWAMLNRKPAEIEDIYRDARIPHEAYRPTFVKSLAMVPIRTLDPVGAIGNYWAAIRQPSEQEVRLLQGSPIQPR